MNKPTPPPEEAPLVPVFQCNACFPSNRTAFLDQNAGVAKKHDPAGHSAKIASIIAHIHADPDDDLTLAPLAARVQLSPFHFARVFRRVTGLSVRQHVIGCRLEFARQRLVGSDLTISRIALDAGFSSQSHLTTVFRRTLHVTPKAYRDRYRRAVLEDGSEKPIEPFCACPRHPNARNVFDTLPGRPRGADAAPADAPAADE